MHQESQHILITEITQKSKLAPKKGTQEKKNPTDCNINCFKIKTFRIKQIKDISYYQKESQIHMLFKQ